MAEIGSFEDAVGYVLEIPKFTRKNTPSATAAFYRFLGKPGSGAEIVHVAGTNGKGSVCAFADSVLREAGYRTGLFTSPHLVDVRERFRLNGVMMGKEEFVCFLLRLLEALEAFRAGGAAQGMGMEDGGRYHPTFFEMLFFIGMCWFEEKGAEYIVLETGMGGRLDATNVIECPAVTVITKIGLDHMEYLGGTKAEIAGEKAGIIKKGIPVVFWDMDEAVTRVIAERAKDLSAKTIPVSETDVALLKFKNKTVAFSMESEYYGYIEVFLATGAAYQRENAALAVRALEILGRGGKLTRVQIEQGLRKARWEGRMEEALPGVWLDGAHNEDGIEAFLESVRQDECGGRRFLLFSAVSDKRVEVMTEKLAGSGLFTGVACAKLDDGRSLTQDRLQELWNRFPNLEVHFFKTTVEAFKSLLSLRREGDYIYAAGSLYMVGEVKAYLVREGTDAAPSGPPV